MFYSLRNHVRRWRNAIGVALFAVVIGQSIGLAHAADLTVHADGAPCRVCDATGPAATPTMPVTMPAAAFVPGAAIADRFPAVAAIRPMHTPQAPRAPPAIL